MPVLNVPTWIQRAVLLLGIIKTVEIGFALLGKLSSKFNIPASGSAKLIPEKSTERGFLYQRLEDANETRLSHGPRDSVVRKRQLIKPLTVPHILGFSQAIIPVGSSVERHVHLSKCETFFCQEGQGYISIGRTVEPSSEDVVLELIPGSCVTVMQKFYHSLHNNGTRKLILLYFGVEQ